MSTLLVAVLTFVGYVVAYNTYGRWIAHRVFRLRDDAPMPSQTLRDDADYVPTNRWVLFGHHFTSIAGTGPIVGPAIAVFWGWLPALLWVLFGSIFIGAVHDFTALVISMRNEGQTLGEVAGRVISPRAKILFLALLSFALMLVLAIFGLVIAAIFDFYPQSVLPVWLSLPVAVLIGVLVNRRGRGLALPSILALFVLYAGVGVGCYIWPVSLPEIGFLPTAWGKPVVVWTVVLLIYCYIASVLPVWMLLQPRDYVNSLQLFVALGVMMAGIFVAGLTGQADLASSAPAIVPAADVPKDAPPILPFLFITVACGAVSGFHSLVSSGTSSKQIARERDAQMIGYGAMLSEGLLAVVVILCCCAGLGMGITVQVPVPSPVSTEWSPADSTATAETVMETRRLTGRAAWESRYGHEWGKMSLRKQVGAFVDGGANFLAAVRVPHAFAVGLVAVLVACFAATTLDSATRLQRYVIQELASSCRIPLLGNKYLATLVAVGTAGCMAMVPGPDGIGSGGKILWPLFGAVNQLVAGLALMVGVFYLLRRGRRSNALTIPMGVMLVVPAWAMLWQIFNSKTGWYRGPTATDGALLVIGSIILVFAAWIVVEGVVTYVRLRRGGFKPTDTETPDADIGSV